MPWCPHPIAESVVVFENCRHTVYGLVSTVNILIHKVYKHILKLNDAEGDRTSVFLVFLFVGCFIWGLWIWRAFGTWWIFDHVSIVSEAWGMQECAWEVLVWPQEPQKECDVSALTATHCVFLFVWFAWLFVALFVCSVACLLVCLLVCLFVCLVAWLLGCLFVCLFVWLLGCLVACLCVCLFVCLSVCLSVCLCVFFFFCGVYVQQQGWI